MYVATSSKSGMYLVLAEGKILKCLLFSIMYTMMPEQSLQDLTSKHDFFMRMHACMELYTNVLVCSELKLTCLYSVYIGLPFLE